MGYQIRTVNVRSEIPIAEIEPNFPPVHAEAFQEMKRFAAHAPARNGINDTSERIGNDVEVWRNFQAMQNDIVARVDDDRKVVWIHRIVQAKKKF
jgi:hypothetical protein